MMASVVWGGRGGGQRFNCSLKCVSNSCGSIKRASNVQSLFIVTFKVYKLVLDSLYLDAYDMGTVVNNLTR